MTTASLPYYLNDRFLCNPVVSHSLLMLPVTFCIDMTLNVLADEFNANVVTPGAAWAVLDMSNNVILAPLGLLEPFFRDF
jgi:hypothetical protein